MGKPKKYARLLVILGAQLYSRLGQDLPIIRAYLLLPVGKKGALPGRRIAVSFYSS
jgi:hypothetical protein